MPIHESQQKTFLAEACRRKKLGSGLTSSSSNFPNNILNSLVAIGFVSLRKQSLKKIPETDAIFAKVHRIRVVASQRGKTLQISIDCKATVTLGDFSRGGKDRGSAAVKALDHDMAKKDKMIPIGIINLENNQLHVFYGNSYKTSDLYLRCSLISAGRLFQLRYRHFR